MSDLDERFRSIERIRPPDLWSEIQRREPRGMPPPAPGRRLVAAAVALVLAGVGIAVAARAFLGPERRRPAASPSGPVEPVVDQVVPVKWPVSVTYGEGSVWASASDNDGSGAGSILRLDPDTAEVQAEIPVPTVPGWETGGGGMALGAGSLWVAGASEDPTEADGESAGADGLLVEIDPATDRIVREIPLGGSSAADVAVDASGVWVTLFGDGATNHEVVRVDPGTGEVAARIPIQADWIREVFAVDGTIWIHEHEGEFGTSRGSYLTRIDPATGEVLARLRTGHDLSSVTAGDGLVWATTWIDKDPELLRLDPRTNQLLDPVPSDGLDGLTAVGEGGVWGRALAPSSEDLWKGPLIVRFNPGLGEVDASVALDRDRMTPIDLAVAPGSVWVVNYEGGLVRIELRPA